ncbi:MAG: glycosyltransferase [Thermodesulfobacteriota bacterium]|nr:MAG: glycosyltransferase [Thermodesulfobacteriota bacterium]
MKKISVVIPVHNEEKNIPIVYKETKEVLESMRKEKNYSYEIIFVNDGSTDNSLEILKELKKKDPYLRVLNMDRQRGQASALTAGFFYAKGDIIVSMDGDGQNDPIYIKDLVETLKRGYKVVTGYRQKRKVPFLTRVLPSKIANWLISLVTGVKVHDNGCSLKAYVSEVPKRLQIPHGFHRFLPAFFGVKNEEVCEMKVIDRPRLYGKSHYNLKRVFEVLRDLISIFFILRNPQKYEKIFLFLFIFFLISNSILLLYTLITPSYWVFIVDFLFFLFTGSCFIIWKNLKRFNKAQVEGVFKVEEIL